MIAGVADFDDERLSGPAGDFIDQAAAMGRQIVVSAISLAEIVYLIEKGRMPANVYADMKGALADPEHVLTEAAFTLEIVDARRNISRAAVPDTPDRIVAATAVYFGVPVFSRDGRIRGSLILRRSGKSYPKTDLGIVRSFACTPKTTA